MANTTTNGTKAETITAPIGYRSIPCRKCGTHDGGALCSNVVCARCWRERAERLAAEERANPDLIFITF